MEALDHQGKSLILVFLSLHYNANSYLFVNGKEILNLKLTVKMLVFQLNSVLEECLMYLVVLILDGNVNDFLVDYNSIDKSNILNIHKYLMIKSNKKQCLASLNKSLLYYLVIVNL